MGRGGRLRPRFRAPLIICATLAGSRRSSRGEKCRTMMPARRHAVVTAPGAVPVFGGQMPGARIDLPGDPGVRPPSRRACPGRGRRRTSDGLNRGIGSRAVPDRGRGRSPSAVDLMPSATSARTERNVAEPLTGPILSSSASWLDRAPAQLDRVRDHRPDVSQLGELPDRIGHRAGHQGQPHRPGRRGPGPASGPCGAAGRSRCCSALPAHRHQHVDDVHGGSAPDAVVHQGRRPGDEAARPGVEQRGHLLLRKARHPAHRQVDAGQQRLPRAAAPHAVLHRVVLHAEGEQLRRG